jgi:hypothetical protein
VALLYQFYKKDGEVEKKDTESEVPKDTLPTVKSYELDLPRANGPGQQFDAEVNAIFRCIVDSKC